MRLIRKGKTKPARPGAEDTLINLDPYVIRAGDIAGILSDEYVAAAFDLYGDYLTFDRLPFTGGTAEQPGDIVDALRVLIEEERALEAAAREKP